MSTTTSTQPSQNPISNSPQSPSYIISPILSLQNVKYFLESYTSFIPKKQLFSEKFLNCGLYCEKSQIPDTYEKLKEGFDRNEAFYIPHSNRRNQYQSFYYKNKNRNMYPKYPLILSKSCELLKDKNTVNKNGINMDINTFFEMDDETDESLDNLLSNENLRNYLLKNVKERTFKMRIIIGNEEIRSEYYSADDIYYFLKNYYIPLPAEERVKINIIITDLFNDIFFRPLSLYKVFNFDDNKKDYNKY